MSARTTVIVVEHDSDDHLPALIADLEPQQASLLLIDNASRSPARTRIDPDLVWHRSEVNLGFGRACNLALNEVATEYVLILNPDTRIPTDLIASLEQVADRNDQFSLFGCMVLNPDGSVQAATLRARPQIGASVMHFVGGGAAHELPTKELTEVGAINGAVMFARTSALTEIGGFDPAYFLHCEDLDLFARLEEAGHRIALIRDIQVGHVLGGSRRSKAWVEYHKHRGMLRYFRRHLAPQVGIMLRVLMPVAVWSRYLLYLPRWWIFKR